MTAKQLKIKLSALTYAPHPKVNTAYEAAGAQHLHWRRNPSYVNEERLKVCSDASGKPITYHISSLYRRQRPGGKEFLLFHMSARSFDYFNNIVEHFFSACGRVEVPIINKSYGIPQGKHLASNTNIAETMKAQELETYIDHFEEVWEFPFENYVEQLKEFYRDGIVDENTNLYVWVGSSKYAVQNFQDFVTLSVDDLTLLARAGTRFVGLLKGQTLTPKILDAIREKLQTELITQINTEKK